VRVTTMFKRDASDFVSALAIAMVLFALAMVLPS
jgi:hypothetical protein